MEIQQVLGLRCLYTGGGESADMLLTLVSTSLFAFHKERAKAFVQPVILPHKIVHSTSYSGARVRRLH